jgi:hypothetical protein
MFSKQESRRHKAERIASQAWQNLSAAVDSAGSATKKAAGVLDETSNRVGSGAKEARKRANDAFDALAGRRRSNKWGWLAAAALVGAAVSWVAAAAARRFMPSREFELPDSLAQDAYGKNSTAAKS